MLVRRTALPLRRRPRTYFNKFLKSGEELRSEIDMLLASTNKIISTDEQRVGPLGSASDPLSVASFASAERENELERASAIAASIKHDVYPAVLFALANELCASGRFNDAQDYLHEVLRRGKGIHFLSKPPSLEELSNAHALRAKCYVQQFQAGGKIPPAEKKLADDQMSAAVAVLQHSDTDRRLGQLAITYIEWADVDERMGDSEQAERFRQMARETAKKMRFQDYTIATFVGSPLKLPSDPLLAPAFKAENLPRRIGDNTFLVSFPNDPDNVAVLLYGKDGRFGDGPSLFLYYKGLLTETDVAIQWSLLRNTRRLTEVDFQKFPTPPSSSGSALKANIIWTIEKADEEGMEGTQSQIGQPSRHFVARLSASLGSTLGPTYENNSNTK